MKKAVKSIISFFVSVAIAIASFFGLKNTNVSVPVNPILTEQPDVVTSNAGTPKTITNSKHRGRPQGSTYKRAKQSTKYKVSQETKEKMSANLKGKKTRGFRPVVQVEIESFELIRAFKSIAEASRETGISYGDICRCCRHEKNYSAGGYFWAYLEDWDKTMFDNFVA